MASQQQQEEELQTFPLKMLVDKQRNKVVVVEATEDFIDTLFSFLSLPLGTIIRLVTTTANNNDDQQQRPLSEYSSPPLLNSITNLYQSVQSLTPNDVWNPVCQQMLLHPRNPIEALCCNLFLNVDYSTEPTRRFFVCDSCNKFTTFPNMVCTCGKPVNKQPRYLDEGQENSTSVEATKGGVFVHGPMFLVFDDLKVFRSSLVTYTQQLLQLGYSDMTQLEEVTQNIGKQEILNLLKYSLTSHEPLTNTILASSSKNKGNPPSQFASAIKVRPCTTDSKMDVKLMRSKSQKKVVFAEANGDFVDFMFSFLTVPLGSIVKLLGGNSFVGCVDNLYKSVETLDSSWCTDSRTVLLNPGVAPQFGCPNQPLDLNIPDVQVEPPTYYYGIGTPKKVYHSTYGFYIRTTAETIEGGVISKSQESIYEPRPLTELDPRSPDSSKEGVVGFVKRPALYGVGDDLKVKPLSAISFHSYLKELSLPFDDLEVKVISIGEAEALSLLRASFTSKFTLTSGLEDFSNVPKQEPTLASKYTQTIQLLDLSEEPKPEA